MAELFYCGKSMAVEPINRPIKYLADALRHNQPVIAELEPGDATHYCLLLVPCSCQWMRSHLGRFGIPMQAAPNYLFVARVSDEGGNGTWILSDGPVQSHDVMALGANGWSRELLAWWLTHLVEAMHT